MIRWGAAVALVLVACRPAHRTAEPPSRWTVVSDRPALEQALASAAGRPVLLDVTASWCTPCAQLQAETFADPRVVAALADHAWIALDVSNGTDPQLALQAFFGANTLPRVLRYAETSGVVAALQGGASQAPPASLELASFVDADEFLAALGRP